MTRNPEVGVCKSLLERNFCKPYLVPCVLLFFLTGCFELPAGFQSVTGSLDHDSPILKSELSKAPEPEKTGSESTDVINPTQLAFNLGKDLEASLKNANLSDEVVSKVVENAQKELDNRAGTLVLGTALQLAETDPAIIAKSLFAGLVKGALQSFADGTIAGLTDEEKILINKTVIATTYNSASTRSGTLNLEATKNLNQEIVTTAVSTLLATVGDANSAITQQISDIASESVKGTQKLPAASEDRVGLGKETTKSLVKSLASHAESKGEGNEANTLAIVEAGIQAAVASIASTELAGSAENAVSEFCGAAIEGLADLGAESESLKVSVAQKTVKATMASIDDAGISAESLGAATQNLTKRALKALATASSEKSTRLDSTSVIVSEVVKGFEGKIIAVDDIKANVSKIIEASIESVDEISDEKSDSLNIIEVMVQNTIAATQTISAIKNSDVSAKKDLMGDVMSQAVKSLKKTSLGQDSETITNAIKTTSKAATNGLLESTNDSSELKEVSSAIVEAMVPAVNETFQNTEGDVSEATSSILSGSLEAFTTAQSNDQIDDTLLIEATQVLKDSTIEAASATLESDEEIQQLTTQLEQDANTVIQESNIDETLKQEVAEEISEPSTSTTTTASSESDSTEDSTNSTTEPDATPPTLTIGVPSVATMNEEGSVSFHLTYEVAPTSLTTALVALNGDNRGCQVEITAATTNTPVITVSKCYGQGPLSISIAPGSSTNASGISDQGASPSDTVTLNNLNPPVLDSNNGLQIDKGAQRIITPTMLSVSHSDTNLGNVPDHEIYFRLETASAKGDLYFTDFPMSPGQKFSFADLKMGKVYYKHLEDSAVDDSFEFTLFVGKSIFATNANPATKALFSITITDFCSSHATATDYNQIGVDPNFTICTVDQLMHLASMCNTAIDTACSKNFKLKSNLDLSLVGDFPMIGGTGQNPFSGIFDGRGHIVKNMTINTFSVNQMEYGFFRSVSGTVKDLGLDNVFIDVEADFLGGIAGHLNNGEIYRSYVTGLIQANTQSNPHNIVGGLVGKNTTGVIAHSWTWTHTKGTGKVGGLVGESIEGSIRDSMTFGTTSGEFQYVGGVVGKMYQTSANTCEIVNVASKGFVLFHGLSGATEFGGIAGGLFNCTLRNSYLMGDVKAFSDQFPTGVDQVGGLVGVLSNSAIEDSYSIGGVLGYSQVGGIVGLATSSSSISRVMSMSDIGAYSTAGGLIGTIESGSVLTDSFSHGELQSVESVPTSFLSGGLAGFCDGCNIANSYSSNEIPNITNAGGALGGYASTPAFTHNYWNKSVASVTIVEPGSGSDSIPGITAITTTDLGADATFSNWDTVDIWNLPSASEYPFPTLKTLGKVEMLDLPATFVELVSPDKGIDGTDFVYQVRFNEATSSSISTADIQIITGFATTCDPTVLIAAPANSHESYTVTLQNCTGLGHAYFTLRGGLATNAKGQLYPGRTSFAGRIIDPCGYLSDSGEWVFVEDSSGGGQDFCVMKYEAKQNGSQAQSVHGGQPWVNMDQPTAGGYCVNTHASASLITNDQWMMIASDIALTSSNWSNGSVGNGYLNFGHSDNSPTQTCPASSDDAEAWVETDCTPQTQGSLEGHQKRTHNLSNGEVIWDFAGNVMEWTDLNGVTMKPYSINSWVEYTDANLDYTSASIPEIMLISQDAIDNSWNSSEGIGQIFPGTEGNGGALLRGGKFSDSTTSGIFSASLYLAPTHAATSIGFRCTAGAQL